MPPKQTITPCLWFDGKAEEAATFYTAVFPNSQINQVLRYPADTPGGETGTVMLVDFTLNGQRVQALNGGPHNQFNDAISLVVHCADQDEIDRYWNALAADGGRPVQCGWLKDRYGVSWQVVPDELAGMVMGENPDKSRRVMEALMKMVKLDIVELRTAYETPTGK